MEARSTVEVGYHSPNISEFVQMGMPQTLSDGQHSRALDIAVVLDGTAHEIAALRAEVAQLTRMVEILPYTLYQERWSYRFIQWLKRLFGAND